MTSMSSTGEQPLKVLHIAGWYPSAKNPVAGTFVREHVKATALYNDVVVLHSEGISRTVKGLYEVQDKSEDGLRTLRLRYRKSPIPRTTYAIYLWSMFAVVRGLVRKGFRPDVIHAHVYTAGVPAVMIGKWLRRPVVVTAHYSGFATGHIHGIEKVKARIAFEHCSMVCPVSQALQRAIENCGIGAGFQVVPNVVDTLVFSPADRKRATRATRQLLFVGLLDSSHKKGLPYLLQALAQLRAERSDWHLGIVGDGPGRGEYETMARRYGIADRITFHGIKSKEEVAGLMRQASLLVLPSTYETFGVVAAEALASGMPVLATRCGGPEEFITEEMGVLVPPGDANALHHGLKDMLSHQGQYARQRISNYARCRFGRDVVGKQLHELYVSVGRGHAC